MVELVPHPPRRPLFGLQVDAMTIDGVVDLADRAVRTRRPLLIGVVNAAKIVHLRSDRVLRESLLDCDVLLADGQSVVWASRLLGAPLPERIAGIDLFERLLALADRDERTVYLLGATPEVLRSVRHQIGVRWPRAHLVGDRDGYFDATRSHEVAAGIAASGADMLFIGMPSPQKETFLAAHGAGLGVPVMHGVGGSFDVLAGVTRRAPERWQRWGLEWLFRVLQEPRRLWRRYLTTNSVFVVLLLRELVHRSQAYPDPRPRPRSRPDVPSTTVSEAAAHE